MWPILKAHCKKIQLSKSFTNKCKSSLGKSFYRRNQFNFLCELNTNTFFTNKMRPRQNNKNNFTLNNIAHTLAVIWIRVLLI